MKLVGIEIRNYACFERQFIPIRQGLNLLVGKNNAGKTSLLKAMAALSAIPLEQRPYAPEDVRTFISDLTPYLRTFDAQANYQLDLYFETERGDPLPIGGDQTFWNRVIEASKPVAIYTFFVMPMQSDGQVIFDSAKLTTDGQTLQFLSSETGGITYHGFEQKDGRFNELRTTNISKGGRSIVGPSSKTYLVPIPDGDYFRAVAPMLHNRYIATHRVVAPWMGLQTAERLPENAENLSVFLQTLRGNRPRVYQRIEDIVREIFPEIAFVNPATQDNRVRITLSQEGLDRDVPLTHSGAGIEQILAIVTFAATAQRGAILLLDEPHSFLHPSAERQLIQFLEQDQDHTYIIATHSAVIINSVEAERVTYVERPGTSRPVENSSDGIGRILLDLGYRNSDILFYDRLLIVEGRTDSIILPLLLRAAGVNDTLIARTGYPTMEGVPGDLRSLQLAVHRQERIITAISPAQQQRLYLFDGDRTKEDCDRLRAMRHGTKQSNVPVKFLARTEIENYLLEPKAIRMALLEEAFLAGVTIEVTEDIVKTKMQQFLGKQGDLKLFPRGAGKDPLETVKASVLLERLYATFENLVYDKERSGTLIARHMRAEYAPFLTELVDTVGEFFGGSKAVGVGK